MEPREIVSSVGLPLGAAALGSVATASGTRSLWYERLEKPAFQPPPIVFPVAWTVLYTHIGIASGIAQAHLDEEAAAAYRRKLMVNMALNAGWSWSFFQARQLGGSVVVAGALAASSIDLARTAGRAHRAAGGFLVPYAAWTTFATVLTAAIWRKSTRRD
ncbi:tryptophan-rich sensory protein [Nocardioides sp. Y6]|uniref:Tryptophan-rich sensory protein n=1 Tax=Nocardioides malaquae TaxID=2773426 RepID=A0ABR9RPK5_9ACTN|nr:TspO/MBR family protein [Nocardioides malaquae]MBE7323503.1 tryptophan-rich sensory protein [Nocardioides malaquae]